MAGMELRAEDEPKLNESLDNIVIVDNLPSVPEAKIPKLKIVLGKIFNKFGVVDVVLPQDPETKKGQGFAFVEFATAENAAAAAANGDGFSLDKNHTLRTNRMGEFDQYVNTPDTWEPPSDAEFDERENLQTWLLDADANDQFALRHGTMTSVFWSRRDDRSLVEERNNWTDSYITFSPRGTYLATFHRQGIKLCGGKTWKTIARFGHRGVKLIDFSPCENYLVTWSNEVPNEPDDMQAIVVWDIKTGEQKRTFLAMRDEIWPAFRWSSDDRFFSRLENGALTIVDTTTFKKVAPLGVANAEITEFAWSPADPVVAYCVPEVGERPARVVLVEMPDRKEIAIRNFFHVESCKLIWQQSGDHLAVRAERTTAKKPRKVIGVNFEIFHLRKRLVPVSQLEIKETAVSVFAWEPVGNRFAIVHGDSPKIATSFYELDDLKVNLMKTLAKSANAIFWSPQGQYCILAGLGSLGGTLEFMDVSDMTSMAVGEHFAATDIEWDPTGRYVVSYVSYWRHQVDTGYIVWSFQGKMLQRHMIDKFYQYVWRPRPPTLLSKKEVDKVRKAYKTYQSRFEAQDKLRENKASAQLIEKRRRLLGWFVDFQRRKGDKIAERRARLAALRPDLQNQEVHEETETIEFFLKEEVEILDAA